MVSATHELLEVQVDGSQVIVGVFASDQEAQRGGRERRQAAGREAARDDGAADAGHRGGEVEIADQSCFHAPHHRVRRRGRLERNCSGVRGGARVSPGAAPGVSAWGTASV